MSRSIGYNTAKFMKASVLSLSLLVGLTSSLVQADEIDDFLRAEMLERKIPGLQLAVVKNGKIIKTASYGLANIQDAVAVDDDTVFSINSITKAFTGVAVMQLVEQGKLELSAKISKYLADLPVEWHNVTVKQLLTHTSGLPDIMNGDTGKLISNEGAKASWELVKQRPLDFAANSQFSYNQTNYLLIGKIIDSVSGQNFIDYITQNQLRKAGMKRTEEAGFSNLHDVIAHSARRYTYYYGAGEIANVKAIDFPEFLRTAAGMSSSAKEIATWVIALQNGELLSKPSSIETLWTPAVLTNGKTKGFNNLLNGYALGWPVVARHEHPAVAPSGGNRAAFFVYPEDDLSIVVLTNLMGGLPSLFIDEIAGFYIPQMKAENGFGLPPAIKTLWKSLESKGYEQAVQVVKELQKTHQLKLEEDELNTWGYKLIEQKKKKQALAIFKLNTYLFPLSANTHDSLAETYWLLGDTDKAVEHYKKVLGLKPDNKYAKKQLKKLKKT
ncbi:serine hydrolase [Colwellia sp. M166]|uniref:serine hydrolase n=1 Tax=Colwellia sp. M166 TaxID=2583805 RepID=UPI00211DFB9D|nr:serine hydrolase [Colwellia sp. M166]|tara:strand:+ start:12949 stop:14442 length:1494 start_codon:yes stop_codon:yes gene_type:complete